MRARLNELNAKVRRTHKQPQVHPLSTSTTELRPGADLTITDRCHTFVSVKVFE